MEIANICVHMVKQWTWFGTVYEVSDTRYDARYKYGCDTNMVYKIAVLINTRWKWCVLQRIVAGVLDGWIELGGCWENIRGHIFMEMLMMVAKFMWTMGPKTKGEDKVFCKTRDVGWNLGNMKMKSNKRLICYSIRYQTGSLIWVLKDMFQFFWFLPKSDYVSLWCLLPVVDEDCENVKTMSGFRTCPHFPLNPIIVNFNLCFFYLSSFYVWRTNRSSLSLNLIIVNFDLGFFYLFYVWCRNMSSFSVESHHC